MRLELARRAVRARAQEAIVPTQYPVVAVIEDDVSVVGAMTRLLFTHGFDVEPYASRGEFLDAVKTTRAICLIVDVQLDRGRGLELVHQLANHGITFPVIFIGSEAAQKGAMETAGAVAFFRKPFSAYLLIEALYDLVDSYSARCSVV